MSETCRWCLDPLKGHFGCERENEIALRQAVALESIAKILALAVRMEGGVDAADGIERKG